MEKAIRLIDYGRFTIANHTSVQDVLNRLGLDFERVDYGRWRYRKGAFAGGHAVEVFWEGVSEEMGICVSISGEGCRLIEMGEEFSGWQEWVKSWIELGAKFSRLDLAIDDMSGELKFEDINAAIRARDYACRSHTSGLHLSTGKRGTGKTAYVGSRQSMGMLRVYDRGFKTKADRSYLRFEWEFTSEKADAIARCFAYEGWDKAFGCCRGFIEFKEKEDRHKAPSLRKTCQWWVELIGSSRHILKIGKLVQESVARSYAWVKRQCSQTLSVLTEIQGGGLDWLYELIDEARSKRNDKAKRLLSCGKQIVFSNDFATTV